MSAKLLVLDIDGTLRPRGEPRVPKENADALRAVQKAGVKIAIATGRCRAEVPAHMLRGIRPDYWICAAGAQVLDRAGSELYTSRMTPEEMYALVDFCEDYEYPLGFSFSDGGYVYLDYPAIRAHEQSAVLDGCLHDGEDQDRHLQDMPFAAFGMLPPQAVARFGEKYGYLGLRFVPYAPDHYDVMSRDMDKAWGLAALAEKLGLAREEIAAVGDGLNDLELLQYAGIGAAMGTGAPELKQTADRVLPPVEEDGLAKFVQELLA